MSDSIFELGLSGGSSGEPVADETFVRLVGEFQITDDSIKSLKERRDALAEEIARRTHVTSADVDKEVDLALPDGRVVKVARGSRYTWDEDVLNHMVDSGACARKLSPEAFGAIEHGVKVSRKSYEKLSSTAQAELSPALTIKPGSLSIKIN